MRILIVDDHVLFRDGLKYLLRELETEAEFLEADNCDSVLALERLDDIDIVLLDLTMPGASGLDALRTIKEATSQASVVILSSLDNPHTIQELINSGADGYIPKSSTHDVLIAALRLVLAGGTYLPPHALGDTTPEFAPTTPLRHHPANHLSQRQRQVLDCAVQGKPNKVIARELGISLATVKAHLSACFRALGVSNRTEAVYAMARLDRR